MQITRRVVNLTTYTLPTSMRTRFGIFDLPTNDQKLLGDLLGTPFGKRGAHLIISVAKQIAEMADNVGATRALIDPPPFLCASIERQLFEREISPFYALSRVERYQESLNEETGVEDLRVRFVIDSLFEAENHYKLDQNPFDLDFGSR
jgi:hypothetical protein